MTDLTGKRALVTGASRGVGAAVAVLLAQRGADIVLTYRDKRPRAEASELAAIVAHKNDPVFRKQLARQQGFIGPEETRILTRMP